MADYKFVAADGNTLLGELQALNKTVQLRLDGFSQAEFIINGEHPTAELVTPFDRDVVVYRNNEPIMRGTIGALNHTLDGTSHYLNVSVLDYRARLNRRLLSTDQSFAGLRDDEVAVALLAAVQSESSLGITVGTVEPGPVVDFDIDAGVPINSAINLLAARSGGFDWHITPDRQFDLRRSRGRDRGRILDYGGAVSQLTLRVNPAVYGNAVFATGGRTTTPELRADVDPGTQRFDLQVSDLNIVDQPVLAAVAEQALVDAKSQFRSFTLTVRQSDAVQAWGGLQDVDVGDTVTVHARSGDLLINEQQRVREIQIQITDDGAERVVMQTDGEAGRFDERLRLIEARLNSVERTA